MEINLSNYTLPERYLRNGQDCFLCSGRKKLIKVTAEEKVRQRLVNFLHKEKSVPLEVIEVEVPLSHFKKGAKGRADVIVYCQKKAILLIECKEPTRELTSDVFEQVYRYNTHIKSKLVAVTNGSKLVVCSWDEHEQNYKELAVLPEYQQLVQGQGFIFKEITPHIWDRFPYPQLFDQRTISRFKQKKQDGKRAYIYFNTSNHLCPAIIRLIDLLMDDSQLFQGQLPLNTAKFVKDGGIRFFHYGNASGYGFDEYYRYFMVADKNGNHQIISFAIYEQFSQKGGGTYLMVAIDDQEQSHHTLEIKLDKYLAVRDNTFELWHDGILTLNKGRVKTREVLDFIKRNAPELVNDQRIHLGSFDLTAELSWEQPEIQSFISKLMDYCFLRDEFRREKIASTARWK